MFENLTLKRIISVGIIFAFGGSLILPPPAHAQPANPSDWRGLAEGGTALDLPVPGTMVNLSPAFEPVLIKGLKVHPENPFLFDFIIDTGNTHLQTSSLQLKEESNKLIKYFFAAMTVPEKDLWVNLSPYEKSRMIAANLGQTEMGRDMLAQDYILKQLTASLIYPQRDLGRTFWDEVYAKAQELYGTTQIPVNTFNKVWIVADKADIFERGNVAYVIGAHLKVMLEEDYLALTKHQGQPGDMASAVSPSRWPTSQGLNVKATQRQPPNALASTIIRRIILPQIEKEVNTGRNFAPLRQMFYAMILASWYKIALKDAILAQIYGNKSKVKVGVDQDDPKANEEIFERYLRAYKKGVFNFIKDDVDQTTRQPIPRKYFSGGTNFAMLGQEINRFRDPAMMPKDDTFRQAGSMEIVATDTTLVVPIQAAVLPTAITQGYDQKVFPQIQKAVNDVENQRPVILVSGLAGSGKTVMTTALVDYFTSQGRDVLNINSDWFLKYKKATVGATLKKIYALCRTFLSNRDLDEIVRGNVLPSFFDLEAVEGLADQLKVHAGEDFEVSLRTRDGEKKFKLKKDSIILIEGVFAFPLFEPFSPDINVLVERERSLAQRNFIAREENRKIVPSWLVKLNAYLNTSGPLRKYLQSQRSKFDFIVNVDDYRNPRIVQVDGSPSAAMTSEKRLAEFRTMRDQIEGKAYQVQFDKLVKFIKRGEFYQVGNSSEVAKFLDDIFKKAKEQEKNGARIVFLKAGAEPLYQAAVLRASITGEFPVDRIHAVWATMRQYEQMLQDPPQKKLFVRYLESQGILASDTRYLLFVDTDAGPLRGTQELISETLLNNEVMTKALGDEGAKMRWDQQGSGHQADFLFMLFDGNYRYPSNHTLQGHIIPPPQFGQSIWMTIDHMEKLLSTAKEFVVKGRRHADVRYQPPYHPSGSIPEDPKILGLEQTVQYAAFLMGVIDGLQMQKKGLNVDGVWGRYKQWLQNRLADINTWDENYWQKGEEIDRFELPASSVAMSAELSIAHNVTIPGEYFKIGRNVTIINRTGRPMGLGDFRLPIEEYVQHYQGRPIEYPIELNNLRIVISPFGINHAATISISEPAMTTRLAGANQNAAMKVVDVKDPVNITGQIQQSMLRLNQNTFGHFQPRLIRGQNVVFIQGQRLRTNEQTGTPLELWQNIFRDVIFDIINLMAQLSASDVHLTQTINGQEAVISVIRAEGEYSGFSQGVWNVLREKNIENRIADLGGNVKGFFIDDSNDPRKKDLIVQISFKLNGSFLDRAMTPQKPSTTGGIDLSRSQINVSKQGRGVEMKFDPAAIARIKREGFDGLEFQIESITPVSSLPLLLGLDSAKN